MQNGFDEYQKILEFCKTKLSQREKSLIVSGNGFSIFNSLKLSREHFHSRMIAALLSSESKSGCNERFFDNFVTFLKSRLNPSIWLQERTPVYSSVSVFTERYIDAISPDFEWGGQIDILIDSPRWSIAIENKVVESEANNQPQQLYRYWRWLDTLKKPFLLIFLSPTGGEAPLQSIKGQGKTLQVDQDYYRLSYSDVAEWIGLNITTSENFPRVHQVLLQYRDYLGTQFQIPSIEDQYMKEIVSLIKQGNFQSSATIRGLLDKAEKEFLRELFQKLFDEDLDPSSFSKNKNNDGDPLVLQSHRLDGDNTVNLACCRYDSGLVVGISLAGSNYQSLGDELHHRYENKPGNLAEPVGGIFHWPVWIPLSDKTDEDWYAFLDRLCDHQECETYISHARKQIDCARSCFMEIVASKS